MFIPSKYQQALFDWVQNGSGHAVVQAVAGSGKTTSLKESSKLIPVSKGLSVKFLAFNKAIAEELRNKLPPSVEVSTLNSHGFTSVRKRMGNDIVLDGNKYRKILTSLLDQNR